MIQRADVAGIIPKEHFDELFNATQEQSAVLQLGRRLRNMSAKEMSLTVQDSLPVAGFVNGDAGLKPTSKLTWKDKVITAEEIAVIIPVPDNVVADARASNTDLWAEIRPQLSTALGKVIDAAVLFGANKPATWPQGIVPGAITADNVVPQTSDGYEDIMEPGGLIEKVEEDGYLATGYVGAIKTRSYLRSIRTTDGIPLFTSLLDPITRRAVYAIDGETIVFPGNGAMEVENAPLLIGGDFRQLVYSIREDIKFEIFNTGVISDADGKVLINLMQQDTSAIRVVMRMGWQLPNPINHINATEATRFPFAVLLQGSGLAGVEVTSVAGEATNASTITVDSPFPGRTYWYKAHATAVAAPDYGDDAEEEDYTKMTLVGGEQTIVFATQAKIRVAEVNASGKIVGVSAETTIVKGA